MPARGVRLYAVLDLLAGGLYAAVLLLGPGRSTTVLAIGLLVAALLGGAGVALLARTRWARMLGLLASAVTLTVAFLVLALLVASAAYLRGVYGGFGVGAAVVCLVIAALVVELVVLLPLFQIRFLLRADVRRYLAS